MVARPFAPGRHGGRPPPAPTTLILRSRTERLRYPEHAPRRPRRRAHRDAAAGHDPELRRRPHDDAAAGRGHRRDARRGGDRRPDAQGHACRAAPGTTRTRACSAPTFNTLTESIARFQREAAQRERLSSLGRLSTVIAHEVRNPLMIIRASLSSLRGDRVSARDIREAVADIDEETQRINRIVSEVLDFAKPIRFDSPRPASTTSAARRRRRPGPGTRPTTSGSSSTRRLPPFVTDAERLRTVAGERPRQRAARRPGRRRRRTARRRRRPPVVRRSSSTSRRRPAHRTARVAGRDLDRRPRRRHLARRSAARLRPLLHDAPRRHRARAADRQEHRRGAGRHDLR